MKIKEINAGSKFFHGSKNLNSDNSSSKSFFATPTLASKGLISDGITLYNPLKPKNLEQPFHFFVRAGTFCNTETKLLAQALQSIGFKIEPASSGISAITCPVYSPSGKAVTLTNKEIISICCQHFGYKFNQDVCFKLCFEDQKVLEQSAAYKGYMESCVVTVPLKLLDIDGTPEMKSAGLSEFDILRICRENNLDGYQVSSSEVCHDGSLINTSVITLNTTGQQKTTGVTMAAAAPMTANHIDIINYDAKFNEIHNQQAEQYKPAKARP